MIGGYPSPIWPEWLRFQWHHVGKRPSRLYFNHGRRGISLLATSESAATTEGPVVMPIPVSYDRAIFARYYGYLCTAASLENVVEIVPCVGDSDEEPSVTGLMFRYSDGSRAAVGSYRLDRCGEAMAVTKSTRSFLCFVRREGGSIYRQYVSRIELCSSVPDPDSADWLELRWKGTVEWWSTAGRCMVYHDGQMRPRVE